MKFTPYFLLGSIVLLLSFSNCGESDNRPGLNTSCNFDGEWLIPRTNVFDGGPGCDGIPALSNPSFTDVADVDFLNDDDLVSVLPDGNSAKLYAHTVLDWHEIINDEVEGDPLAIVYCPLTGTGVGWDRRLPNGETTTFGVSGLLYNSNIIPYDRATGSNWSQQRLECVNGELAGETPNTTNLVEMRWGAAKNLFPNGRVTNYDTGFNRSYGSYPYGDFRENHDNLIFPVEVNDDRLPRKQRVLGVVINGMAKAYPFTAFPAAGLGLLTDEVNGETIVVVGSQEPEFLAAFYPRRVDGNPLSLRPEGNELTDTEGNRWNLLGRAVGGPRAGEQLPAPTAFVGYWFSWGTFYPGLELEE